MLRPVSRKFRRNKVARRKARRVSELNTRRINKRKYYGLGVEIDEMKEALEYHFTHSSIIDNVRDSIGQIETVQEDVASDTVARSSLLRDDVDAVLEDVEEPLSNSYKKGTRRAFDAQGNSLNSPDDMEAQVQDIVQDQRNYISKLDDDLRNKAIEIIRNGVAAGLTKSAIIENLRTELKNMIDNRTSTISNSEIVGAGMAGILATFRSNGVDTVSWVSSGDNNVCRHGNFRVTFNGTTYTSCRELDGESFELPRVPRPVLNSHPRCRCLLVANDADE